MTVSDDGKGHLTATPSDDVASLFSFTNTYEPAPVSVNLKGTKLLLGRDQLTPETFTFQARPADSNTSASMDWGIVRFNGEEGANALENGAKDGVANAFSFDDVSFSKPGTYSFNVTEQQGNRAGVSYDSHTAKVTVVIVDDPDSPGMLKASSITYDNSSLGEYTGDDPLGNITKQFTAARNDTKHLAFVNVYESNATTTVSMRASKQLTGRTIARDEFSADISTDPQAGATSTAKHMFTATSERGTTPDSNNISTALVLPDGAMNLNSAELDRGVTQGWITKEYEKDEGETADWSRIVWIVHLKAQEVIPDGATQASDGTWTYQGVTYDTNNTKSDNAIHFTVRVEDPMDGKADLFATVQYPDGGITFNNAYKPTDVSFAPKGTKTLEVPSGLMGTDIAGKYQFTLTGVDGAPVRADGATNGALTTTNTASGDVDFSKLTFTSDDLADATPDPTTGLRSKTFTYQVTESGTVAGVTNDAQASSGKTFTVTVSDDGQGNLKVTSDPTDNQTEEGKLFSFENTYKVSDVSASITDSLKLSKKMSGRPLTGDQFTFDVRQNGRVVQSVKNAADGSITLPAFTYNRPGTYLYTITEQHPRGATHQDDGTWLYQGTQYSGDTAYVRATVVDKGDGTLAVSYEFVDLHRNSIVDESTGKVQTSETFTNSYYAEGSSVSFKGAQKLTGANPGITELPDVTGKLSYTVTPTGENAANTPIPGGVLNHILLGLMHFGEYAYAWWSL